MVTLNMICRSKWGKLVIFNLTVLDECRSRWRCGFDESKNCVIGQLEYDFVDTHVIKFKMVSTQFLQANHFPLCTKSFHSVIRSNQNFWFKSERSSVQRQKLVCCWKWCDVEVKNELLNGRTCWLDLLRMTVSRKHLASNQQILTLFNTGCGTAFRSDQCS